MMSTKHVGIISCQHESNTFLPSGTTLENFTSNVLLKGEAVREYYRNAHHEVGGFFAGLEEANIAAVPLFAAQTVPSGVITAETCDALLDQILSAIDRAGPLDGLLVAPHGAAVSENEPDMDGYWLTAVRNRVGPKMPVICTLDPHANISSRMIDACDATITYRTNPHLDQRERGIEAATLMARTLRGGIRPTQAAAFCPLAMNIERQSTDESPLRDLEEDLRAMTQLPGVLSTSVAMGFPYADVQEMGTSLIVVTDNDSAGARSLVDQLAAKLMSEREKYRGVLIDVNDAIEMLARNPAPVCLLDMGDNVGGGSPADGTVLARALHEQSIGPSFVCIYDPESAAAARSAGVGVAIQLAVGGKTDTLHGDPLSATFRVISLHDGTFTESRPRHGGSPRYLMGPTAIVETASQLTVMLTSRRTPPFSLAQLTSCGLDPREFKVIVAKGVHAPVAAYREACATLIRVNTPGVTTADMSTLTYQRRRRPLFPFER